MSAFKRLVAAVVVLGFSAGCASSTLIRTNRPAAKIYVDGEYRGAGAVRYTDMKIVGSTTFVKVEEPGCAPETFNFSRNEEFNPGACLGGVLVLFPFLWIMDYKPEHNFEYACRSAAGYPYPGQYPQPYPQQYPAQQYPPQQYPPQQYPPQQYPPQQYPQQPAPAAAPGSVR